MNKYYLTNFLYCPISLSQKEYKKILSLQIWHKWQNRLDEAEVSEIEELRRFFIAPVRDNILPNHSGNSKRITLNKTLLTKQLPKFYIDNEHKASIEWVDLLYLDTFSMLIIKVNSIGALSQEDILETNRKLPSWHPRHSNDQIAYWVMGGEESISLKEWIGSELLQIESDKISSKVFGDTDWFGHSLPAVSYVGIVNKNEKVEANEFIIKLLVGAPDNDARYLVCSKEKERLVNDNIFQIWQNWMMLEYNNKNTFVCLHDDKSAIYSNVEKHYSHIAMIVFYQKIMLTHLMGKFIEKNSRNPYSFTQKVRLEILEFKRSYVFNKVSTYSLGESIYQFIYKNNDINNLINKLSDEIESRDDFERIQLDKQENNLLTLLGMFATVAIPFTTIGTYFTIDNKFKTGIFSPFWMYSLGTCLVVSATIFFFMPPIRRHIYNLFKKQ